jgi:hypothetical protein
MRFVGKRCTDYMERAARSFGMGSVKGGMRVGSKICTAFWEKVVRSLGVGLVEGGMRVVGEVCIRFWKSVLGEGFWGMGFVRLGWGW